MFYTFNGRPFKVNIKDLESEGGTIEAIWYDPRTGAEQGKTSVEAKDIFEATPPGAKGYGNDWVLILKKQS